MTTPELRFGFGENWDHFVANALSDRQVNTAIESLRCILRTKDLTDQTFLDIGCGSGLFSLAACLLGATSIVSFDYDQNSVQASTRLRAQFSISPERWHISRGDVLSAEFMATVAPADIVYSWGVLHHTGALWQAIDNAASKVKPGGLFTIAIYNHVESRFGGSKMWWKIKRTYNSSPVIVRRLMEFAYVGKFVLAQGLRLRNPFAMMRRYDSTNPRGMDFWHDARDWLGGFPYEYATAGQVFNHVFERHGSHLVYLNTPGGYACNEFTFRRPSP